MFRASFLLRRTGSAWLLVGCLMLPVLVTSALEELMISGPAALVGLGLGVGLAHLLITAGAEAAG
jgi:hypothetical protein